MYVSSAFAPVFSCNFPSLQTHTPQCKGNITPPHFLCLSNCLFLEVWDRCSLSVGHVVWFLEAVTNWLACLAVLFSALRMGTTQPRKHEAGCSGIDHGVSFPSAARHITRGIDHTFTWLRSSRTDDGGSKPALGKISLSALNYNVGRCNGGNCAVNYGMSYLMCICHQIS
jgi:hypothetical protein